MDGRPKRIKKFARASICVYNRLRVDGAIDTIHSGRPPKSSTRTGLEKVVEKAGFTSNDDDYVV